MKKETLRDAQLENPPDDEDSPSGIERRFSLRFLNEFKLMFLFFQEAAD